MSGHPYQLSSNGVVLSAEAFGERSDPPIVLVMGATASMLWWPESLCRGIADAGHFVIRYDHRDTGRSTTGAQGEVAYNAEDMAEDLVGLMDALQLDSAHLVGMSLGGYISQMVAVRHPSRVRSLSLIGAEPLGVDDGQLPGIDERFMTHFATLAELDWSDTDGVREFLVEIARLSAGTPERFDLIGAASRVTAEIERASDIASAFNHGMVTAGSDWTGATGRIIQPTLVIHGENDPILPIENGRALASLIAGSRLHVLRDAGHELNPLDLPEIQQALLTFIDECERIR